jgi:penicillin-binding protein 2
MADPLTLIDPHKERSVFRNRLAWILFLTLFMTGLLVTRYYHLQITRHADFATLSDANRIFTQTLSPTRGLIYDRNGILLAENIPSFSLNIVIERISSLDQTLAELEKIIDVEENEIANFKKRLKRSRRPYSAVPLRQGLTDEEIARVAVHEHRLPGVQVDAELVRNYPQGELFAHSIGYVGSINDRDLKNIQDKGKLEQYRGIFSIGKTGIEKTFEHQLLGLLGEQNVETNARGRVIRELEKSPSTPGADLILHLDAQLQEVAATQLASHRGAIVALDTASGGVLAAVSAPSFDPNKFVTGISIPDYAALRDSWKLPLFNRIIQGQYPPGSTVKPHVGLAGLEAGVISPSYAIKDEGFYQLPDEERLFRDWKKGGHQGKINIVRALEESCDTFYYDLAYRLGIDRIHPFLDRFGLGEKTGVEMTSERSGLLPHRAWKKKHRSMPWFPGDTLNIGIGQGDMLVTPMQLAYATSIIANRGKRVLPRLVKQIGNELISPNIDTPVNLDNPDNWDIVIQGMEDVVHGSRGTARSTGRDLGYRMAGKTGTAQVVGIKQDEEYDAEQLALQNRDHALFIAFAPIENPRIAVAVVVENGEHGSSTAAPMARALIDAFMSQEATKDRENDLVSAIRESNGGI